MEKFCLSFLSLYESLRINEFIFNPELIMLIIMCEEYLDLQFMHYMFVDSFNFTTNCTENCSMFSFEQIHAFIHWLLLLYTESFQPTLNL